MQIVHEIPVLREIINGWRRAGEHIAFVPTMGNLHDGHLSLVEEARRRGERVVSSIFVNPMQFNCADDYGRYPRTFEEDAEQLRSMQVDLLFAPFPDDIYPEGMEQAARVEVPGVSEVLEGEHRPGHFTGVATIVTKLFNLVQPDVAVFGEKDFQQLAVIRRMTADLNLPVEIVGAPTLREPHGLAMSSRNNYLSAEEREQAGLIYAELSKVVERMLAGERNFTQLERDAAAVLNRAGFQTEYIAIRRLADLQTPHVDDQARDLLVLAAAHLGKARLIDNLQVHQYAAD
jgi:pantoate--beta-alanine ligase